MSCAAALRTPHPLNPHTQPLVLHTRFPEPCAHLTDLLVSCTHVLARPKCFTLQDQSYWTLFVLPFSRIFHCACRVVDAFIEVFQKVLSLDVKFTNSDAVNGDVVGSGANPTVMLPRRPCAAPHTSPVAILALVAQHNGRLRAVICSLLANANPRLSCNH